MLVSEVDGPYSRTSADVQDPLDLGIGEIWWTESKFVIKGEKKQVML